jgi:hypothetical protein
MGGSKPKPAQPTREERALMRAQLQTLSKQDEEINERKRRIIRGQYSSFGGLLKRSGTQSAGGAGTGGSGGSGGTARIPTPPRPGDRR